jgi:allantoin racemase
MRRILVINPNTNPAVTQRVREVAEQHAVADVCFEVVNPPAGPFSIETPAHRAQAQVHALALIRSSKDKGYAAYVMACFDDLALEEARALVDVPVVGTCEAGIAAARAISPRFAVITTVHDAVGGIRVLMSRYGAGPLASVRAAGIGVAEAASAQGAIRERFIQTVHDAVREDGAQAILLASGGLTGQAPDIAHATGMPVLDGVEEAIRRSLVLVEQRLQLSKS